MQLHQRRHCERSEAMTECGAACIALSIRISPEDTSSRSRGSSRPSFASLSHPQMKEGAGKTGSRLAPIDRHARSRLRMLHAQRVTGQPETSRPSLRSGFTAYVVLSPGSDALLPPSPCGWLTRVPGRAAHITARLGAQTPDARTTRFCRTPITPVVCATPPLTVARPAKAIRADVTCVHRRPARVRDDRDTPLFLGPDCGDTYAVSEFR